MLKKDSAKDFYGVYRNHILYDLTSCRRLTWTFQHPLVSKSTYLIIIILQWVKGSHSQMCTHHFKIHNSRVGGSRAATLLYAPTKYSPYKIQCAHIELYINFTCTRQYSGGEGSSNSCCTDQHHPHTRLWLRG